MEFLFLQTKMEKYFLGAETQLFHLQTLLEVNLILDLFQFWLPLEILYSQEHPMVSLSAVSDLPLNPTFTNSKIKLKSLPHQSLFLHLETKRAYMFSRTIIALHILMEKLSLLSKKSKSRAMTQLA